MGTRCLVGWVGLVLCALPLRGGMLESAWRARGMLGPGTWAEVLRIEKTSPAAAPPAVVFALVFELEGRLWYYAENSGTESLSLYRDHLAEDEADPGPLLRAIDPGFGRYEVLDVAVHVTPARAAGGPLPQGCFIECVAYLREMVDAGQVPEEARLVAYYAGAKGDSRGHTVLSFTRAGQRYCYDPSAGAKPRPIPATVSSSALAISGWAAPGPGYAPPRRAVFLPLSVAGNDSGRIDRTLVARTPDAGGPRRGPADDDPSKG